MPENVVLLTARRSYEFAPDQIRLSVLTLPNIRELVQGAFGFVQAGVGSPIPTFGDVPQTLPPGLAFDLGYIDVDGELVAIRFLHFEPRRIVIDVAGPSAVIDVIYDKLRGLLASITAPDGQPALGEHNHTLEYSEITATFGQPISSVLQIQVAQVLTETFTGASTSLALLPAIYGIKSAVNEELVGDGSVPAALKIYLAPRAGSLPSQNSYFSGAPLNTDKHLAYLDALERALT